jgi:hypothetical protein
MIELICCTYNESSSTDALVIMSSSKHWCRANSLTSSILPSLCEELLFLLGALHSVTMKLLMFGSEEEEGLDMATGTIPSGTAHVNARREMASAQRNILARRTPRFVGW